VDLSSEAVRATAEFVLETLAFRKFGKGSLRVTRIVNKREDEFIGCVTA